MLSCIFDDDDPRTALEQLRPDIWVKGGDYGGTELPEAATVRGRRRAGRLPALPVRPIHHQHHRAFPARNPNNQRERNHDTTT